MRYFALLLVILFFSTGATCHHRTDGDHEHNGTHSGEGSHHDHSKDAKK